MNSPVSKSRDLDSLLKDLFTFYPMMTQNGILFVLIHQQIICPNWQVMCPLEILSSTQSSCWSIYLNRAVFLFLELQFTATKSLVQSNGIFFSYFSSFSIHLACSKRSDCGEGAKRCEQEKPRVGRADHYWNAWNRLITIHLPCFRHVE